MTKLDTINHKFSTVVDASIWYLFLVLFFSVSFINTLYDSVEWYFFSFCIFTLSAVLALSGLQNSEFNFKPLIKIWPAVVLFSLSVFLLLLQTVIPYNSDFVTMTNVIGGTDLEQAAWFKPNLVWSVTPHLTWQLFWSEVTMLTSFLLTIILVNNRARVKQLLAVVVIVLLIHSSVGIAAKIFDIFLVDRAQLDGHFSAARAWFINRNHFAAFIGLTLFAPMSYFFKWVLGIDFNKKNNIFNLTIFSTLIPISLSLLLGFVALSLSQSRSGFLAILIALPLVLVSFGRHFKLSFKRRYLMLPIMIIATVSVLYFGSDLLSRFNYQDYKFTVETNERLAQWQLTWSLIQQEWLLGYGGNSYSTVFQAAREHGHFREVIYNQAHNDYLHIWLEQGLIGLLCWVGLLAFTLKHAWTAFAATSSRFVAAVLISASTVIVASLLQSGVGFNLQILNIRFYFFVIMALIFAVSTIKYN